MSPVLVHFGARSLGVGACTDILWFVVLFQGVLENRSSYGVKPEGGWVRSTSRCNSPVAHPELVRPHIPIPI